jgi:hypothetical protein
MSLLKYVLITLSTGIGSGSSKIMNTNKKSEHGALVKMKTYRYDAVNPVGSTFHFDLSPRGRSFKL